MWQIERGGSPKERAVPTWTRFLDENVPGYDWSGDEDNASQMKRKGKALCDRIVECGAGGNGGREEERTVDDMGQSNTISCKRAPHRPAVRRLPS